jgi:hypothetical protein
MLRPLLAAALLLSALAGCDTILGSRAPEVVGVYELTSAALLVDRPTLRVEMLSDTLWLYRTGAGKRVVRERHGYPPRPDTIVAYESDFGYTMRGGQVEVEFFCGPLALCSAPPHMWGRRTDEGLELRHLANPDLPLAYRRLEP